MEKMKYALTVIFEENLLGTVPYDKAIYAKYLSDRIKKRKEEAGELLPEKNEVDFVKDIEEKGWTGFMRDERGLFVLDYLIKGFLKNAAKALQEAVIVVSDDDDAEDEGTEKKPKPKKAKKERPGYKLVNDYVFIHPRRLYFGVTEPDGILERPLRAMTMQGERVTLSRSDYINKGRELKCEITVLLNKVSEKRLRELLDYGFYMGLGQWRNARWGSFSYFLAKVE